MSKRHLRSSKSWFGALSIIATSVAFGQSLSYGGAPAADPPPVTSSADATRLESDRTFVCEAAAAGILEVKMSRIAMLRANSNQVRHFAQNMVYDHSRMNRKLKETAWSKDLKVCDEMDRKRAKLLLALERSAGDEFDREYLTLQVDGHRRMVRLFQQQAQTGGDDELRDFAGSKLPVLEAHLQTARLLADSR